METEKIPRKSELSELYRTHEKKSMWRLNCRQTAFFGAVFMMAGTALDAVVYPHFWTEFLINRLVTSVWLLVIGYWVFRVKSYVVVRVMLHLVAVLPLVSISVMISYSEGALSPYYAGLNLVLVGAALLLKWFTLDAVINLVLCMLSYVSALYLHGSGWSEAFIPSYFIFVTGAITCTGTFFSGRARFREFCLTREVEGARQELEHTNQQLRAIDETKSRFFANLSHELRTPLTLILGPAENLRGLLKRNKDPLCEEYLDTIEENGYRLLRIINDILDLVKLDSGESPPRPESIDLKTFIEGMVSNIKPIASIKGVSISSHADVPQMPVVWLDRDRLEKIILNLAVNAVKFTASGGSIALFVGIGGGKVSFTVTDTGQGMSQDDVENVFVRFWQADMSAKRKHRGAGIGLSLVKSLAESMGGGVKVESVLGEGTTFDVILPATEPPEGADLADETDKAEDVLERFNNQARERANLLSTQQSVQSDKAESEKSGLDDAASEQSPAETRPTTSGDERKKVLVADDEEAMRHFIARQLGEYDLVEARDGEEAWALAQQHRPDLIILDLMMPGLDGIEVTRNIRAHDKLSRVPVILITAQASETPRLEALEAGVNDFISKPFSTVELGVRAKNLLHSADFENRLANNNQRLETAYGQLKEQESLLVQTEKLSSLGRMSAGIVHEVNNPLNYTKTALHALETFKRVLPEDEQEDYLDVLGDAREGVQRVIGIVSDLRSFTRGDSAHTDELVLGDVVESARRLASSGMSGMEFTADIDDSVRVDGNEGQLCQLLVNFLQNSARAIQVKEDANENGKISVRVKRLEDGTASLSVRDNGCGVSLEVQKQIFDPFFTQNDVGEGMGLGLSICHRIIKQHHAEVSIKSEVGRFTEFTVIFPKLDSD